MEQDKSFNIFDAFEKIAREYPQNKAIYWKREEEYECLTYENLASLSASLGRFLIQRGVKKADKIALILENSYFWPVAFMGIMHSGATAVPLDPLLSSQELSRYIRHSDTAFIITSCAIYQTIKEIFKEKGENIFPLDAEEITRALKNNFAKKIDRPPLSGEDIASLVYTSGTTETPRAAILSHKNFLANVQSIQALNIVSAADCFISILPLQHTYPFMVNLLLPLLCGAKISYPAHIELEEIISCMNETGVTVMVCVPRLLVLLHQKIKKALKKSLIGKLPLAVTLGISGYLRRHWGINLAKFTLQRLHNKFGKKFRFIISGGARLQPAIAEDFFRWGFLILEGYGLTEASPVAAFNRPREYKFGSAGKPLAGVAVKINEPDKDGVGEILIKGENVSSGYYKEEELSQQTIKDGWLHSGDLGFQDKDNFLYIQGRRKEIIVLSTGKNINPEEVEFHYLKSPYIEEICVFASTAEKDRNKDTLSSVLLPDYNYLRKKHVSQIKDKIRWEIETLSRTLPPYKRVKKYTIIDEHLPKTLLGKIKRYAVEEKYAKSEGERKPSPPLSLDDEKIISSPICRKALDYLRTTLKRDVHLDDYLELDLGLDSLEQISLFLGFQKMSGLRIDEREFLGVFTVRDLMNRLESASGTRRKESIDLNWEELLRKPLEKAVRRSIPLKASVLEKIINFIFVYIMKLIVRTFFLLRVKGRSNLPKKGPFLICPNHASYLDGLIIACSLDFLKTINTYFLGYAAYFRHPLLMWTNKLFRLIPIDPASTLIESLKVCSFILRNSKLLCMFPEGARSPDGNIGEFKRGAGILIKELNVAIVPAYIKGTYQVWGRGRKNPQLGKVTVTFGKPLTLKELTAEKRDWVDIYKNIVDNLKAKVVNLKDLEEGDNNGN